MKLALTAGAVLALTLVCAGCDEDKRGTEEKIHAPAPDQATRWVMVCPHCGAPTRPYRVNRVQSFYQCSGMPPKFASHDQVKWTHNIAQDPNDSEQ